MFNLIHRGTSPIVQEQNGLSPVADEVEIGEESRFDPIDNRPGRRLFVTGEAEGVNRPASEEAFMGLTGDHFVGTYGGHTLELVSNEWARNIKLLIDGKEVARASRILPRDVVLTGTLEHGGPPHAVVARSVIRFPWTEESIEIDGHPLELVRKK